MPERKLYMVISTSDRSFVGFANSAKGEKRILRKRADDSPDKTELEIYEVELYSRARVEKDFLKWLD